MKKRLLFLYLIFIVLKTQATPDIPVVNIPDANFRAALLNDPTVNTNNDAFIQTTEAEVVINLDMHNKSISDLRGIDKFTALKTLQCYTNSITSLDISKNTELILLDCGENDLTILDLSSNTKLQVLNCNFNNLTSLDLSANAKLSNVICNDNALLSSLNVGPSILLKSLVCTGGQLSTLDISANTALTNLECFDNILTTIDVTHNLNLSNLNCSGNELTSLNVKKNASLTVLDCTNNSSLDTICISTDQFALKNSNPTNWVKPTTAKWSTNSCSDPMVIDDIEAIPGPDAPKTLIHIYNLLGQEVGINETILGVVFIYQYSDGSVKKILKL